MKYNINILATSLILCFSACDSEELNSNYNCAQLTVTADYSTTNIANTKTTLTPNDNGIHVTWAENDKIRIMQANADLYTTVDLLLKEGAGSQTATFEGNNFPNITNTSALKYQAFYPATIEGTTPTAWKGNATYEGQIQKGNGNTDHLSTFDYLVTDQVDNLEQTLQFMHIGLIFCFDITMPKSATSLPASLTLTTISNDNTPTTEGGLFKNCNQDKTPSVTLNFQECTTTTPTFKAYLMCNCNIPTMQKILVTLTLQDGSIYSHHLTAQQPISSIQSNSNNNGTSYVIPISRWEETKNSIFNAETKAEKFAGTGTVDDPYIIESAENLKYLIEENNNFAGKYFSLATNIKIQEGTSWTPIGSNTVFSGIFDGNGHTIKGEVNTCSNKNMGLFSETNGASISNLNSEINISNETCENVGGIIALATKTIVTNCHYNGNISAGTNSNKNCIGGIIAYANTKCQIKECSTRGSIRQNPIILTNDIYIGGIVAKVDCPDISQCKNYAEIKGDKNDGSYDVPIGGIVGKINENIEAGKIEECYNYGEIYGASFSSSMRSNLNCSTGGIVGHARGVKITRAYNYGTIHAQTNENCNFAGGIIGMMRRGGEVTLNECANYGEVIGNANGKSLSYTGGIIGYINSYPCIVHKCHNAGNISVITDTPQKTNICVGSYIGCINDINYVYDCCSTAAGVIIKDANGETVPTSKPNFYVGNSLPLIKCPDNHPKLNN